MQYFIVSASKNHAQLYEVRDDRILPRGVDGMPTSMAEAWQGMERQEKSIQFYGGGPGAANNPVFHGTGGGAKETEKQEEEEYYHKLAKSMHTILHEARAPVVFAGVPAAYGLFKKYDMSGYLLDAYIHGSPDRLSPQELKEKADEIVRAAAAES